MLARRSKFNLRNSLCFHTSRTHVKPRHDHEDPEQCGDRLFIERQILDLSKPLSKLSTTSLQNDRHRGVRPVILATSALGNCVGTALRWLHRFHASHNRYGLHNPGFSCRSAAGIRPYIHIRTPSYNSLENKIRHIPGLCSCADVPVDSRVHGALARSSKSTASPGNQGSHAAEGFSMLRGLVQRCRVATQVILSSL
jgi:hypothetical protein